MYYFIRDRTEGNPHKEWCENFILLFQLYGEIWLSGHPDILHWLGGKQEVERD